MSEKKVLKFDHTNIVTKKGKNKSSQKKNKEDISNFNDMAKQLREKLIDKNKITLKHEKTDSSGEDINSFDNAIQFLQKIRERRNKKKKRRMTVKCHTNKFPKNLDENKPHVTSTNSSSTILKEEPKCGILKNGSKPLWRDFHKTRKKKLDIRNDEPVEHNAIQIQELESEKSVQTKPPEPVEIKIPEPVKTNPPTDLDVKSQEVAEDNTNEIKVKHLIKEDPVITTNFSDNKNEEPQQGVTNQETHIAPKIKVTIGKSSLKQKVSLLLKRTKRQRHKSNKYTRKNLLRKHGFIKESTKAPDDVIQLMYESITDSDDICNINNKQIKEKQQL